MGYGDVYVKSSQNGIFEYYLPGIGTKTSSDLSVVSDEIAGSFFRSGNLPKDLSGRFDQVKQFCYLTGLNISQQNKIQLGILNGIEKILEEKIE